MNIEQDIKDILAKHYKNPDKLELNESYIKLFRDLVEYIKKLNTERIE